MKLSKRSQKLMTSTGYSAAENPAIAALVAFAAQNSGIDPRNYFDNWRDTNGRRAYAAETRSISADLARFRDALAEASAEGVTDADVIAEAPHAFSGRLEWNSLSVCPKCGEKEERLRIGRTTCPKCLHQSPNFTPGTSWEYCTGQYFPTEYRKAAATLMEYATRRVRGNRPAAQRAPRTISELKALNKENGFCWFSKDTMSFFRSQIESGILKGRYFITSEQFDDNSRRKFTVREFDEKGSIDTVGEFQAYGSRSEAVESLAA